MPDIPSSSKPKSHPHPNHNHPNPLAKLGFPNKHCFWANASPEAPSSFPRGAKPVAHLGFTPSTSTTTTFSACSSTAPRPPAPSSIWKVSWKAGRDTYNGSEIAVLDSSGRCRSSDHLRFIASHRGSGPKQRLTMDFDGNLRIYSLDEEKKVGLFLHRPYQDLARFMAFAGPTLSAFIPSPVPYLLPFPFCFRQGGNDTIFGDR